MGKILHFSACRGEEYFTAPHNTSRRGGFSFTPAPSRPTGGTQLTLLGSISAHARNSSPSVLYFCCGVRKSSPCKPKRAKNAVFRRAGRVFSRKSRRRGRAGRVFSRQSALHPGLVGDVAHEAGCGGGFAALEAGWRRVVPLMTPYPPFGDGLAEPSAASARAPSRRTSPRRARRRSSTTTSSRRRRNMSAALDRLKQQNEPE